jgi:histidinol phosphatase-like enzyme (inositol monophosphatase family)
MATPSTQAGNHAFDAKEVDSRLGCAIEMAHEAGRMALDVFRRHGVKVEHKADGSEVTAADREGERLMRARIAQQFPNDAVLGEEEGSREGTSGFRWLLDPIDGTRSFVRGVPLWGTLVACEIAGRSILGVVFIPALEEMVFAMKGYGAWHVKGEPSSAPLPVRVSSISALHEGVVCTTSFDYFRKSGQEKSFLALSNAARSIRGWSDCYAQVLCATGRIEAVVEPMINPWDVGAIIPIIEEAGGRYTTWEGEVTAYHPHGAASNGLVHDELLRVLRSAGG